MTTFPGCVSWLFEQCFQPVCWLSEADIQPV